MLRASYTDRELRDTAQAYQQLISEGLLSWATAVNEMRAEFGMSVLYLTDLGIVKYFQQADKHYHGNS